MILRDAVFSSERRHLGAQPAPAPVAQAHGPSTLLDDEVREMPADYDTRAAEPTPLSSEHVASWLVTQDGATRTALASLLSDDLAALRDGAHTEGYEHGHKEAVQEAREKVRSALATLGELNEAAAGAFDSECIQLGEACVDIVAEVFFKLAGDALISREAVVGVVNEVIKRVREERELRIHVNPADLPVLRTAEAGIAANLPGRRFTFVADARVETGGCIVESALGSLDGRLEVQLAELCASLRSAKSGSAE
jgi:flagellar assembly protein FliH